jgi:hypothetical protein
MASLRLLGDFFFWRNGQKAFDATAAHLVKGVSQNPSSANGGAKDIMGERLPTTTTARQSETTTRTRLNRSRECLAPRSSRKVNTTATASSTTTAAASPR